MVNFHLFCLAEHASPLRAEQSRMRCGNKMEKEKEKEYWGSPAFPPGYT